MNSEEHQLTDYDFMKEKYQLRKRKLQMEYQQKMKDKKMKSPNYMEITLESNESMGDYGGKDSKSI